MLGPNRKHRPTGEALIMMQRAHNGPRPDPLVCFDSPLGYRITIYPPVREQELEVRGAVDKRRNGGDEE
jgi:hypothetical protein